MHKSGKIAYREDRLKWDDFATWVTNLKTQHNTAKFAIFFQHCFIKPLQALVGMLRDVNKLYWVTLIKADIIKSKFFLSLSAFWKQKSMTLITYFLGYHWAKDTPLWLTKRIFSNDLREQIANNLCKCPNHSPIFTTNFSQTDQNLVPTLSCHFLPVKKSSFWKALEHF